MKYLNDRDKIACENSFVIENEKNKILVCEQNNGNIPLYWYIIIIIIIKTMMMIILLTGKKSYRVWQKKNGIQI